MCRDDGDDSDLESGFDRDDDFDSDGEFIELQCASVAHLEALAAPVPFHASTKAALGPRLLDTLRGLRGADAELPAGWRDEVEAMELED